MQLLHVEDDPLDADLVSQALQRTTKGIRIDLARGLSEARERLQHAERYDAALIDLQLPDGSGLELLAEIRKRQLPMAVVLLTGSGDQHAAIAALQSGADDYVPKSIEAFAQLGPTLAGARRRFDQSGRVHPKSLNVLYAEHNASDIDLTRRHFAKHAPFIRLTVVPDAVIALSHLPLEPGSMRRYAKKLLKLEPQSVRVPTGLPYPVASYRGSAPDPPRAGG